MTYKSGWLRWERLGGLITGAVLAFVLTMSWDVYKDRREQARGETILRTSLLEEIRDNQRIVEVNRQLLQQELAIVDENKQVVTPLTLLKTGIWDLLKVRLSDDYEADLLNQIRDYASLADSINDTIRSREAYRTTSEAMSNFSRRLRIFDEVLLDGHSRLGVLLPEIDSGLAEID
jgi:hypothetical protein